MGKVQNMYPWSMDPLRGPGPWTGSIKIWTGSMDGSMDRVHGPGPRTESTKGVHGPGEHVLYFPAIMTVSGDLESL